jgi:hypothetical protein
MRKLLFILFISLGSFNLSFADGFCEGPLGAEKAIESAAGVITYSGAVSGIGDCSFAPDEYQVTIYEMSLCTASPTAPTSGAAFDASACSIVINSPAGQTINMAAGSELALADFIRPPNGKYTHGHMLISNSFGIKVTKEFTNTMFQNNTSNTGKFCWTLGGTEDSSDFSDASPPSAAASPSAFANCGAEGAAAPAMYTERLDEFDSSGASQFKYGPVTVQSGAITAFLVTAATSRLVSADNTADRLFGIQSFTTPIVVKPDASSFTISFGVNQATQMQMDDESGSTANQYEVIAFGSGPFSSFMTVE